jgi:subtilisin family serine protease
MIAINRKQVLFGYLLLVGVVATLLFTELARARNTQNTAPGSDLLIKVASQSAPAFIRTLSAGTQAQDLGGGWIRISNTSTRVMSALSQSPDVEYVQPNYKIGLLESYQIQDPVRRKALQRFASKNAQYRSLGLRPDNPAIPAAPSQGKGNDPFFSKQWGMNDIGVQEAWKVTMGNPNMIVAVIDTGVDYTHEDLAPNMWRNPNEIPDNQIDDDKNGYVDDVVGWDFVSNDNKPYDLATDNPLDLLTGEANPGHGTHCAGNVGAKQGNGLGIAGVAPGVRIMALRFISEKGSGDTAGAVQAIHYAVDNGAKVLSNSWGGEGKAGDQENVALREAIEYAQSKGVLFVVAAGNGRNGVGFNNDTDPNTVFPAAFTTDNIVTVAAIDNKDQLAGFSNFGAKTVHIGAPGVAIFSTTPAQGYSDTVIDKFGFHATWDGTSMATPHVAGAAALYWSAHPTATYKDVRAALLNSATKIPSLAGKVSSEGKLNVKDLMKQ